MLDVINSGYGSVCEEGYHVFSKEENQTIILYTMKYLFLVAFVLFIKALTQETEDLARVHNDSSLVGKWKEVGLVAPRVVFAQTYLETCWLTSKIYRKNHNRYGMKWNKRGFAKGVRYGHAYYDSEVESMMDYMAWQKQMLGDRVINSDEEYLYFLDHLPGNRRYAEDPNYTNKLRRIIKKIWKSSL